MLVVQFFQAPQNCHKIVKLGLLLRHSALGNRVAEDIVGPVWTNIFTRIKPGIERVQACTR